MPRPKIIKPGQIVYDFTNEVYVRFKADLADRPNHAFLIDKDGYVYTAEYRPLNRKELGLP